MSARARALPTAALAVLMGMALGACGGAGDIARSADLSALQPPCTTGWCNDSATGAPAALSTFSPVVPCSSTPPGGLRFVHLQSTPPGLAQPVCTGSPPGGDTAGVVYVAGGTTVQDAMDDILDRGGVLLSVAPVPKTSATLPGGPRPTTDVSEPAGGYMSVAVDSAQGTVQRSGLRRWRVSFHRPVAGVDELVVVQVGNRTGDEALVIANLVVDGPPVGPR